MHKESNLRADYIMDHIVCTDNDTCELGWRMHSDVFGSCWEVESHCHPFFFFFWLFLGHLMNYKKINDNI